MLIHIVFTLLYLFFFKFADQELRGDFEVLGFHKYIQSEFQYEKKVFTVQCIEIYKINFI